MSNNDTSITIIDVHMFLYYCGRQTEQIKLYSIQCTQSYPNKYVHSVYRLSKDNSFMTLSHIEN